MDDSRKSGLPEHSEENKYGVESGIYDRSWDEENSIVPESDRKVTLEFKDYIALSIAALQTVLAPLALFIVAIFALLIIINALTAGYR
ncbi:MAG: hypothetical protein ACFFD4_13650 [Candidatus Odinarchaeota archaeon]